MRLLPTDSKEWAKLVLLPFKVFTVVTYPALSAVEAFAPARANFNEEGVVVLLGYVLSFLVLVLGTVVQRVAGLIGKEDVQTNLLFVVADLIFGFLSLRFLAS